jgi:D-alanyl-D-alanine carboxypeptidase
LSLAAAAVLTVSSIADAGSAVAWRRHHLHRHIQYRVAPYSPPFAAIVVDGNSGRTLYSANEDAPRHPASLTKVMTLYLLFEQLDKGAMTLQTEIPISEHAAAQEPSKLGIQAGDSISVDDAIKAIVTRSANDVAVAIAEAIGHDESTFAEAMTRKAHALGMTRTTYRNASGLPNDQQITTAHDLAILGRAVQERFPRYFHYFSTHEFEYAGEVIGNHDHLLGRVDGVDGIKTGYTRASGFNLLTSLHRDGRSLVGVVLGGPSTAARDRLMETLIATHVAEASTKHSATMIAEAEPVPAPSRPAAAPVQLASARVQPVVYAPSTHNRPSPAVIAQGDNNAEEDDPPTLRVAAVAPAARRQPVAPVRVAAIQLPAPRVDLNDAAAHGWTKGPDAATVKADAAKSAAHAGKVLMSDGTYGDPPAPAPKAVAATTAAKEAKQTIVARAAEPAGDSTDAIHKGWIIQIGATDDAAKANDLLIRARAQNHGALAAAKPVTEKVKKGEDIFYRARFAGLDSADEAETACRSLKRNGFSCFTAHD